MSARDAQVAYKAHIGYAKDHPAEMALALHAVNRWNAGEATLAHAIAEALAQCFEAGRQRRPFPEPPQKAQTTPAPVLRRTRR